MAAVTAAATTMASAIAERMTARRFDRTKDLQSLQFLPHLSEDHVNNPTKIIAATLRTNEIILRAKTPDVIVMPLLLSTKAPIIPSTNMITRHKSVTLRNFSSLFSSL